MRAVIGALSLVFALGGFATVAQAGEGCSYGDHAMTKKNDFEAPPPAAAVIKPDKKG